MRIQHNVAALNSYRNYNTNTTALSKNLEKLSSGYRVNRAGDDAAGLAISEKMRAQITGLEAATKNAKDGISLIQTAEGALTEVHSMLNRMYSLAEQSANGIYTTADRANLAAEVTQLQTEIGRIATSVQFNKTNLVNGDLSGVTLQIGPLSSDVLTINGVSSISTVGSVSSAVSGGDVSAISQLDGDIAKVSTIRGTLGALQNRLEHTVNNLGVMTENMTNAESQIRDTDVAEEMMKYTKNNILVQSAQAMLAQANQTPQGVLQLLQ